MISLTEATRDFRLVLKIAAGVVACVILIFLLFRGFIFVKDSFFTVPEGPQMTFGTLPSIDFPARDASSADFSYQVNTITGALPTLPDRMRVFKTEIPEKTFLSVQDTRANAERLGFTQGESELSSTLYRFVNEQGESITIDTVTKDFDITSSYRTRADLQVLRRITDEEIISRVFDLLKGLQIDTTDIDSSRTQITYYEAQNQNLIPVEEKDSATIARIDLYQAPLDVDPFIFADGQVVALPVVYPDEFGSSMNFFLVSDGRGVRIAEAHFHFQRILRDQSSTYPVVTVDEAFQQLQEGNAFLRRYSENQNNVEITDVSLGYYIGPLNPEFVFPVIRFIGTDFEAYVPLAYTLEEVENSGTSETE